MVNERISEGSFGLRKAEALERLRIESSLLEHLVSKVPGLTVAGEYILEGNRAELEKNPDFVKMMGLLENGIREERELFKEGVPKEIIQLAVKRKKVHRLGDFLLLSDELLKEYIKQLKKLGESFTVQEAKEKLGLTRKYLIPLLEHLDYLGLTERKENKRVWRA